MLTAEESYSPFGPLKVFHSNFEANDESFGFTRVAVIVLSPFPL